MRNCTIAQYHQAICAVLSHFHALPTFKIYGIYTAHSPFNARNDSLFACLHGCAVACASCATKQTFVQCRIFLEGTLLSLPTYITAIFLHEQRPLDSAVLYIVLKLFTGSDKLIDVETCLDKRKMLSSFVRVTFHWIENSSHSYKITFDQLLVR